MKIEILKMPPYSYPEQISSSHLTQDLNDAFYEAGFHTTVYTPSPCRGINEATRKKYKKIKHELLRENSIDVYRFPMFKEGKNPICRAIRYILCNLIQFHKGVRTKGINVVFSGSTPPTQGLLCGCVAKRLSKKYSRKVSFVYNLQDVFPDSLVSAGMASKGSFIWKIGRKLEDQTYKLADKIIVISDDIKDNIYAKGVPEEKIVVIPNWIDTTEVIPIPRKDNTLFDELSVSRDSFIVVYAGNLGMVQGIDTLINAAKQLDSVVFLIFGDGKNKEEYARKCIGSNNIKLLPLMPRNRVSEVYSMGNLCLVACKKGTGHGAVPSKTYSIMATGTPVLLSFDQDTSLWTLINNNKCGLCAAADDTNQLVEKILYAKNNPQKLDEMGKNARQVVEKNYSKEIGTKRMTQIILDVVDESI